MRTERTTSEPVAASLTDDVATTPEIVKDAYAGGVVFVPVGSEITDLTFHGCGQRNGTFLPLYASTTAVTLTVEAGRAYVLPAGVADAPILKIEADADGDVEIVWMS